MKSDILKIIEKLSPNERRILPYIDEKEVENICKKANLDKVSVTRSLTYLQNKGILKLIYEKKSIIDVGVNGALYRKKGLPERRLLHILNEKRIIELKEAGKESKLSDDELKASIGVLKKKGLIEIKNDKLIFNGDKEGISKKTSEESFLELLPLEYNILSEEQQNAFKSLKDRKEMIQLIEESSVTIELTELGKNLVNAKLTTENLFNK